MGALKPTVSGIGFYLLKRRAWRGRDPDLSTQKLRATEIPKNSVRPGSDFIYTNFLWGWSNTNLVSKMSVVVDTICALRALVLKKLMRSMGEL